MKNLKDIILEKFKIDKNTNVKDRRNILDVEINSLEELRDIMKEYFESKYIITVTSINSEPTKWKTQYGNDKIKVNSHFSISFFKNTKVQDKLQFAEHTDGYLLMQMIVKDYTGKMRPCRIHGGSTYNTFKPGDNLYDFIKTIVNHTNQNHPIDKDPNIIKLFKDIK